jgi:hypothetical protein
MKEMTTKVRLIIGGLVIVIIVMMFGGEKSPDSTTAPTPNPIVTEQPTKVPSVTAEDEYLYAIKMSDNEFYMTYDDADLIELGWVICESLDAGITFDDIVLAGVDSGLDPSGIGTAIGAAVSNFCTRHYDATLAWLDTFGL